MLSKLLSKQKAVNAVVPANPYHTALLRTKHSLGMEKIEIKYPVPWFWGWDSSNCAPETGKGTMDYQNGKLCVSDASFTTSFPYGPFGGFKYNFGFGDPTKLKQFLDVAATLKLGIEDYTKPLWFSGPVLTDSQGGCHASKCSRLYCSADSTYKNVAQYSNLTTQYLTYIKDMANSIKNNPNLTAISITHGLDGEGRCKPDDCTTQLPDGTTSVDPCIGYSTYQQTITAAYYKNFCNGTYNQITGFCEGTMIPLFVQNTSWGDAAGALGRYMPPMGLKFNGFVSDTQGIFYGKKWRGWGTIDAYVRYRNLIPTATEPKFGNWFLDNRGETGGQGTYWWNLETLWLRPTFIDINPAYGLRWNNEQDPEYIKFLSQHLGVTAETTPDVWVALRDTPNVCGAKTFAQFDANPCLNEYSAESGKRGDYDFFLRRPDNIPENKTIVMSRPDVYKYLPDYLNIDPIKYYNQEIPIEVWQNKYAQHLRRTDKATGNFYMSFDIDNDYPWSFKSGRSFEATLIFLDLGSGPFYIEYKDSQGQLLKKEISRNNTKTWKVQTVTLDNAYFNDGMGVGENGNGTPTFTDFRIYNGGTNKPDIYLHIVKIKGLGDNPGSYKKTTQITCSLPNESIYRGDTPKLEVKLTDRAGKFLGNKNIRISLNPYAYSHRISYGQTNSSGISATNINTSNLTLHFQDNRDVHEVEVVFPGDADYLASSTTCYLPLNDKNRSGSDMLKRNLTVTLSKTQVNVGDEVNITINTPGGGNFSAEGEGFGMPACMGTMTGSSSVCTIKIGGMAIPGRRSLGIIVARANPYAAVSAHVEIMVLGGENPEVNPPACPRGDLGNLSCEATGLIDSSDLNILLSFWNKSGSALTSSAGQHTADITGDGKVDASDLDKLLSNWGN